jgi:hypothetical protein
MYTNFAALQAALAGNGTPLVQSDDGTYFPPIDCVVFVGSSDDAVFPVSYFQMADTDNVVVVFENEDSRDLGHSDEFFWSMTKTIEVFD